MINRYTENAKNYINCWVSVARLQTLFSRDKSCYESSSRIVH